MKKKNKKIQIKILRLFKNINLHVAVLLLTLLVNSILLFLFLKADSYLYHREIKDYEAGKVAERTIIAEYDFDYIDRKSTSKMNYDLERNITPVFKIYNEITEEAVSSFDLFSERFNEYLKKKKSPQELETGFADFLSRFPGLTKNMLIHLYEKPSAKSILEISRTILDSVMNEGIIVTDNGETGNYQLNELFEIWRWVDGGREKEDIKFAEALTRGTVKKFASAMVNTASNKDEQLIADLVYDFEETQKKRERVLLNTNPVFSSIKKGDVIVEKGFIITDKDMEIIRSMGTTVTKTNYRKITAVIMYLISIYFLAYILFSIPGAIKKSVPGDTALLLILAEIFFIYTLIVFKLFSLPEWLNYALLIPAPLFAIVLSLVVSQSAGIFFAIIMSYVVLVTVNFSPFAAIFCLLSGISGVLSIRNTETRIDLIIAGIKTGLFNVFFINTLLFFTNNGFVILLVSSGIAFLNGFISGILTLGVLPIIEHVLNSPTRFRLIELSDLNNPILKKMHSRAPGTFSHSLNVGNLAETACREIGANPLLARVGAYYHDIGKIDQAEYFIENQQAYNKHDDLKPSMSVSVIKSHVKIGIEKAKELNLPQAVIDIISQHHGNGLISFFYVQALKLENKAKITPLDYSYTEGKPRSKEAAVVLLADSVEAAIRTLKKPTISKIEKFIWQTLLSKIETDQITESELTF
ncbi:MAG TPA: hypothetical protein DCY00_07445, partial [Actinobacteria bacterium]|nr:hypothetical protein [Actinomycetota bacterium]